MKDREEEYQTALKDGNKPTSVKGMIDDFDDDIEDEDDANMLDSSTIVSSFTRDKNAFDASRKYGVEAFWERSLDSTLFS